MFDVICIAASCLLPCCPTAAPSVLLLFLPPLCSLPCLLTFTYRLTLYPSTEEYTDNTWSIIDLLQETSFSSTQLCALYDKMVAHSMYYDHLHYGPDVLFKRELYDKHEYKFIKRFCSATDLKLTAVANEVPVERVVRWKAHEVREEGQEDDDEEDGGRRWHHFASMGEESDEDEDIVVDSVVEDEEEAGEEEDVVVDTTEPSEDKQDEQEPSM